MKSFAYTIIDEAGLDARPAGAINLIVAEQQFRGKCNGRIFWK